jgi:hypothetical protein
MLTQVELAAIEARATMAVGVWECASIADRDIPALLAHVRELTGGSMETAAVTVGVGE